MKSSPKHRIFSIALIGLLFSCSILEDTDITSYEEFNSLTLKSIQITETLNGAATLKTALVTEESISETLPNGSTLTKRKTISWPAFSNPKLKFRSGVTSDITLVSEYVSSGKIRFWRVKSAGVESEKYEFLYNSAGNLAFLKTTITTNINGVTSTTLDTDQYSIDELNFPVVRNAASTDLTIKANFGGTPLTITDCGFKAVWQSVWNGTAWVNKKEYNYCGGNDLYTVTPTDAGGRIQFKVLQTELLEEVYLAEIQSGGSCCTDKFYFHPYLFMPGDLRVKIKYAPDWWKEEPSFSNDIDQSVKLKFNYE